MEKYDYQLICMSFDGDFVRERQRFTSIDDAWKYSDDLGSRWYFYPFHFVVKNQTIKDSGQLLEILIGKRIKTVKKLFEKLSQKEEAKGMDYEEFAFLVLLNS